MGLYSYGKLRWQSRNVVYGRVIDERELPVSKGEGSKELDERFEFLIRCQSVKLRINPNLG